MSEVIVLTDGYSTNINNECMAANCTCTLIKGQHNIIIDTMTPWDSNKILDGLQKLGVAPNAIDYVVSTHGHSDHTGNNNLFLKAKHIVGYSVSFQDKYYLHPFDKGQDYQINPTVKVIPTPGHTLTDVSVIVIPGDGETIAIAGDLFEKYEDIEDPSIWLEAGSEDPKKQLENRMKVAEIAEWIIPGHGPKFKVTEEIRIILKKQNLEGSAT